MQHWRLAARWTRATSMVYCFRFSLLSGFVVRFLYARRRGARDAGCVYRAAAAAAAQALPLTLEELTNLRILRMEGNPLSRPPLTVVLKGVKCASWALLFACPRAAHAYNSCEFVCVSMRWVGWGGGRYGVAGVVSVGCQVCAAVDGGEHAHGEQATRHQCVALRGQGRQWWWWWWWWLFSGSGGDFLTLFL